MSNTKERKRDGLFARIARKNEREGKIKKERKRERENSRDESPLITRTNISWHANQLNIELVC